MILHQKKLGNLISIAKGKKHDEVQASPVNGSRRYIQIDDLRNNSDLKYTTDSGVEVNTDDVIIAWDGANAGTIGFGLNGYIGSTLARLRILDAQVYPRFLGWFLRNKSASIREKCSGATIPHVNKSFLESLNIPLPLLPIQKQIAAILEKADAVREKRRQANKLTEQFLQSAFLEMFGDPVTNPKGWEKCLVEDVTTSHDSKRVPIESSIREGRHGTYPYYGASGVIDYIDDFIFDYETVLIGEDGANLLARSTPIAFIAKGKYWVNNHAHVLTPKVSMTQEYLVFFFNRTNLKPYISGSAQPKLTATNLSRIPIPVPPIHEQQKFAALVEKVELLRAKQRESEKELDNLFNCLMQRAFKGELEA